MDKPDTNLCFGRQLKSWNKEFCKTSCELFRKCRKFYYHKKVENDGNIRYAVIKMNQQQARNFGVEKKLPLFEPEKNEGIDNSILYRIVNHEEY